MKIHIPPAIFTLSEIMQFVLACLQIEVMTFVYIIQSRSKIRVLSAN